jgi:hypothetical protein
VAEMKAGQIFEIVKIMRNLPVKNVKFSGILHTKSETIIISVGYNAARDMISSFDDVGPVVVRNDEKSQVER